MDKTTILAKGPTARHVYERAQYFLQNDPDLQGIANDFTPEMFTVKDIEVLQPFRHKCLHQGFRGSKLHKDNKGCGDA